MVVMSMTNCVNSTGFFSFGGGGLWGRDIFFIFISIGGGGVFIKNMNNILPCLPSLLGGFDCSCHIRLYLNKIFGLKTRKTKCICQIIPYYKDKGRSDS